MTRRPGLLLARNASALATAAHAAAPALTVALSAEGTVPDWIQLLPSGPAINGADGRRFTMGSVATVIGASRVPFVLDYEHATERPEAAGKAPAAGWVEELADRGGAIWGRVDWTPPGRAAVQNREYRFISPVFHHTRDAAQRVVSLVSAGLVHRPNLDLKALNTREDTLELLTQLLATLGLPATTSEADALAAVRTVKAANAAGPDLAKYVPAEQHNSTVAALNAANAKLSEIESAGAKVKADTLIDDAVKAGKIAPAAKAEYLALALNHFDLAKAAIDKMPAVLLPGSSAAALAAEAATGKTDGKGLTDSQKAVCSAMGLSEDAYAKSLAAA